MTDSTTTRTSRRQLLLGIGAALTTTALAACGGGSSGASPAAPGPAKAATGKISWLVRNNAPENDWQKTIAIPGFQQVAPQASVELILGGGDYDAKLTSMAVGGQPPEIWTHWGGNSYVDYLRNGWLEELTPLVSRDKFDLSQYVPNTVEWFKNKGKLYALPFYQSNGSFLFYNKNLLKQAGVNPPPVDGNDKSWTFDALVDLAKKLTRATGGPDATFGLWMYADTAQFLGQTLAKMMGGDIFLPEHYKDGIAQKTQLDSQEAIDGYQYRQDLYYRTHVIPTPADIQGMGVTGDVFTAGKVALNLNAGWAVRNYKADVKDFDWAIAPIPTKKQSIGPTFTDAWMLGKQSPNKDGGWALIKYLLTPDAQRAFVQATGTCSPLKAVEDEWFKLMSDHMPLADVRKVAEFALQHSFEISQHTFAKWSAINTMLKQIADPIWKNQSTAADALKTGKPQLDQIVAQAYQDFQSTLK